MLTTKGIDDSVVKLLHKNGIFAIRRVSIDDLKKIAISCGTKLQKLFYTNNFKKQKQINNFGTAEEVFEQNVSDSKIILIRGCNFSPGNSVLLRGANNNILEEIYRSLIDAISVLKRAIEGKKLLAGGGACEISLNILLQRLSDSVPSREQLPIYEFGEALLLLPKTLLNNAGIKDLNLLSKLRALHTASSGRKDYKYRYYGLDLSNRKLKNNVTAGVVEPALSKLKSIQMATEAAITILRIDDFVITN